jgi:hypothetical protein
VWNGVADFQVWNEANVAAYWSGTPCTDGDPDGLDPRGAAIRGFARAADQPRVRHPAQQPAELDRAFYGQRVGGRT